MYPERDPSILASSTGMFRPAASQTFDAAEHGRVRATEPPTVHPQQSRLEHDPADLNNPVGAEASNLGGTDGRDSCHGRGRHARPSARASAREPLRALVDLVRPVPERGARRFRVGISCGLGRRRGRPDVAERGRRRVGNALDWKSLLPAGFADSARGEPLISLAPDRGKTLEAVRRISIAGRGGPTASVLLENVCAVVAETLEFDSVGLSGTTAKRRRSSATAGSIVSLLAEARKAQNLVFLSAGGPPRHSPSR